MQLAFRGRPSKGCNRCRQRKVKCDEGHPHCDRCVKGSFECVYRDEFDLMLRNQTNETAVKAQRKWRSRAKKSEDAPPSTHHPLRSSPFSDSSEGSSPRSGTTNVGSAVGSILVPLSSDPSQTVYELASKRFLFDFYVDPLPQLPSTGFGQMFPQLIKEMVPGTCFYYAMRASSLANYGSRCKSVAAASLAAREYGRAIQSLSPLVADPDSSSPREALAAINLLSVYEMQSTPYLTHGGSWQAHINGSAALLKSVVSKDIKVLEQIGGLFISTVIQMLSNKMSLAEPPTIPLSMVYAFAEPTTTMAQTLTLMYRATNAVAEFREAEIATLGDMSALAPAAIKLVEECDALDTEIAQWVAERAPTWGPVSKPNIPENVPEWLKELYTAPGAPTTLRIYPNFYVAHRIAMMRGTRIQVHHHTLTAVDVLIACAATDAELSIWLDTQTRLERRLLELIDIAMTSTFSHFTLPLINKPIPKTIEDVPTLKGYSLIWPIYRSGMCFRRDTLAEQDSVRRLDWIKTLMLFVGDGLGFKKCKAMVDNIDGKFGTSFS